MSKHEVGYGKPPKKHQFKPGQSGNPKGRPKGQRNFSTILIRELSETLSVKEGGKTKKLTKIEAVIKQLVTKAVKGDARALAELLRQISAHWPKDDQTNQHELPASDEDMAILFDFMRRTTKNQESDDARPESK